MNIMPKNRIEVSADTSLLPGEVLEMWFKIYGSWSYLQAAEVATLKWRLEEKFPELEIVDESPMVDDDGYYKIWLKRKALPEGVPVSQASTLTAAIIATAIIGGGILFYLSLQKVYKLTDSPSGQIALAGTGALGFAFLILAIAYLFGLFRKRK